MDKQAQRVVAIASHIAYSIRTSPCGPGPGQLYVDRAFYYREFGGDRLELVH